MRHRLELPGLAPTHNFLLSSFHKQSDRTAWANYDMPSSRRQTQPRLANPVVGTILDRFAKMRYNASRGACKVPLKQLGATTKAAVSAGYLRQLLRDNLKDQKYCASLKKFVADKAPEIFQVQTIPTPFEPSQFYPTKIELHSQQVFGKNNSSKSYTVVPVMTQIADIV